MNTPFTIVLASGKQETVIYKGRSLSDDGAMFTLDFKVNNAMKQVQVPNPAASISNQDSGPRLASADNEFGLQVPGEIIGIDINPGDELVAGERLGTVESMKMQIQLTVPEALVGKVVDQIFTKSRTAEAQGDILPKNGLFFTVRKYSTTASNPMARSTRRHLPVSAKPIGGF